MTDDLLAAQATVPQVLSVCVHNAGHSQLAAALLQHYGMGRIAVRSAGSEPADKVNPAAATALGEWGLDIAAKVPSKLSTEDVESSDVVITMGCGDTCPIFPGKRYHDWELDDPAGQSLDAVARSATRSTAASAVWSPNSA